MQKAALAFIADQNPKTAKALLKHEGSIAIQCCYPGLLDKARAIVKNTIANS